MKEGLSSNFKEINQNIKSGFPAFFKDLPFKLNEQRISDVEDQYPNFPYDDIGELLPNISYESEGYKYETDNKSRIKSASGNLRLEEGQRDSNAQLKAGGDDRQEGDQGGHLIGRQFGGSGKIENLVAMKGELNQGNYKSMEMDLRKAVEDNKNVDVTIDVKYDGNSKRPSKIIAAYVIDGEKTKKIFNN